MPEETLINYVKFLRGTPEAYEGLSAYDNDTIYFVSEADASTGSLYVGNKLISTGTSAGEVISYLRDLQDVDTSGAVQNSVLGYDVDSQTWKVMDISDAIDVSVMVGATNDSAGTSGLVPAPQITDKNSFLCGDGTWKKVNTDSVQMSQDLVITAPVGTITQEMIDENGGSVTIDVADKSFEEILAELFTSETLPEVTLPAATLTATGGTGEVGTTFTLPTATFKVTSVGSYTYGAKDAGDTSYPANDTGVVFNAEAVTVSQAATENSKTNSSPLVINGTLSLTATGDNTYTDDPITFNFVANASYTESADRIPVSNIGTKHEELKIASGSLDQLDKAVTFTGYRKSFYGANAEVAELNSANIRALTSSVNSNTNSFVITTTGGEKQLVIAVPSGRQVTEIKDANAFNTNIFSVFTKTTVSVEGANAYTGKDYNVYSYAPPVVFDANTYSITVTNE